MSLTFSLGSNPVLSHSAGGETDTSAGGPSSAHAVRRQTRGGSALATGRSRAVPITGVCVATSPLNLGDTGFHSHFPWGPPFFPPFPTPVTLPALALFSLRKPATQARNKCLLCWFVISQHLESCAEVGERHKERRLPRNSPNQDGAQAPSSRTAERSGHRLPDHSVGVVRWEPLPSDSLRLGGPSHIASPLLGCFGGLQERFNSLTPFPKQGRNEKWFPRQRCPHTPNP